MPSRERQVAYTTGPQLTHHDRLWLEGQPQAAVLRPTSEESAFAIKLPTLTILECRRPDLPVRLDHVLLAGHETPILRTTITLEPTPERPLTVLAYSDLADPRHQATLDRLARQSHLDLYFYNEYVCGIYRRRLANTWRAEQRRILRDTRRLTG